jgi:hypothetical protein
MLSHASKPARSPPNLPSWQKNSPICPTKTQKCATKLPKWATKTHERATKLPKWATKTHK